jgi:hypothetical protein
MFRPVVAGQVSTYGLKFRNQCVDIMDLFATTFPQSKHLFMYRNALDWVASLNRLMSRHEPPPPMTRTEAITSMADYLNKTVEQVEPFFDPSFESYSIVTLLATSWLIMMDRCLDLYKQGIPLLIVRYESLDSQREAMMAAIFDYCGLPRTDISVALQAFSRDSQQGTRLARENPQSGNTNSLSEEQIEQIHAILRRHPVIQTPDFILPGTLQVI